MNTIELRLYQRSFIDDIRSQIIGGQRRVCGVAPCGAGKTIMTGWMIKEAVSRGNRCVFFVHRKELIDQTADTFRQLGINFGVIAANVTPHYRAPVQIASVQTLANRLNQIPEPQLLICDECHHILAATYKRIIQHWSNAILVGVTATPRRTNGSSLGEIFTAMVEAPTVSELIQLGNLTNFRYFAPVSDIEPELKKIHVRRGDYDQRELTEAVTNNPRIIGDVVENYLRYAGELSAICYAINVAHSKHIADEFNRAGIPAMHVDGETDPATRRAAVRQFREGKIKILCNAELFGEGFDVPNVGAVILVRPTMSLTLHIQQSMRCMRPDPANPDKVAVIIDHVGNYTRHGFPDSPRTWSLKPGKPEPPPKTRKKCPACEELVPIAEKICPVCGHPFDSSPREVNFGESAGKVAQVYQSGNVSPVEKPPQPDIERIFYRNKAFAKRRFMQDGWVPLETLKSATSYQDCLKIAALAGYKKGWAHFKWQELQQTKNISR